MNLRLQAEQKCLPEIQEMDIDTLKWIESNRDVYFENFTSHVNLKKTNFPFIEFLPDHNWFLNKSLINSLHGIRHISRVLIYSNIIGSQIGLDSKAIKELCLAVSLHDVRRINDKKDIGHGERAGKWFLENRQRVFERFKIGDNEVDIYSIVSAIQYHETPLKDLPGIPSTHRNCLDLIKLVDALDRFRLPDLSWWLNESYLATYPPDYLVRFAFLLVLKSEKYFLKNEFDFEKMRGISDNILYYHE